MRTTVADAKANSSGIARVLGLCASDSRFLDYLNEAIRRLLTKGLWVGTVQRYVVCVDANCLVWPRQFAAIEKVAVCDVPVRMRNGWFEFMENGIGIRGSSTSNRDACGGMQLFDRDNTCAFADIIGVNKKIKVYADVAEDDDAKILLQGYDENKNWIQTQVDGEWVDGEYVTISTTPQTSTKFFSSLTGVQKPITNGYVRLYEFNTDDSTQRAIAIYEPDETTPWYRKSFINGLTGGRCCGAQTDCDSKNVTVMAKMEFIPVRKDTDYLLIGNLAAIKDMCQSIRKLENNLFTEAKEWEANAIHELDAELETYRGHGNVQPIQFQSKPFNASVTNLI